LMPLALGTALGSAAWVAGQGAEHLGGLLDRTTFQLVHHLLTLFRGDAYGLPEEALLGTSTFYVRIAPECSGYQGIGLIGVFLITYLWVCRDSLRFPRALLLLPLGVLVMYLANVGRIAALVAVGTYLSPEVALGGFHSQAGWLIFNGVVLGVVYATRRLGWLARREAVADRASSPQVTAAYLVPLLGLVGATMFCTAFSNGFDGLYPLRVLVVAALLWHFRAVYQQLSWRWSWTAAALGVLVFALWLVLEARTVERSAGDSLAESLRALPKEWAALWLVFRVVGSVLTVPLAEELAFRAYLLRRCQARDFERVAFQRFSWFSFLLSSLLFGLLHGRWLAGTLAGMVFALAVYRRGKPADAVLAHAVTNGLIAAYVLATGSWGLWS
ncbi:MAG: exosortase E/protease, VPEID-CTERM system, partial [Gemmataceae bacterium]